MIYDTTYYDRKTTATSAPRGGTDDQVDVRTARRFVDHDLAKRAGADRHPVCFRRSGSRDNPRARSAPTPTQETRTQGGVGRACDYTARRGGVRDAM